MAVRAQPEPDNRGNKGGCDRLCCLRNCHFRARAGVIIGNGLEIIGAAEERAQIAADHRLVSCEQSEL